MLRRILRIFAIISGTASLGIVALWFFKFHPSMTFTLGRSFYRIWIYPDDDDFSLKIWIAGWFYYVALTYAPNATLAAVVSLTCMLLSRVKLAPRRTRPGFCPVCGYDLRASPSRCPECGTKTPRRVPNQFFEDGHPGY